MFLKKIYKIKGYFFKYFPTPRQWLEFFNVLSKKEKIFFIVFFCFFLISALFLQLDFYFKNTAAIPDFGGEYKEGIIGAPRFINPLYLSDNDADRDLVELIFSGLLKYNEKGEILNDLAEKYEITNNNKNYEFTLKNDIFWHDGEKLTSEDIIFTLGLVQSPQYKSPLRIEWLGVKAEAVGENKIVFQLQNPYSSFPETIARLKILPKHIFQDVVPENLPWVFKTDLVSKKYLIGSGPFKVKTVKEGENGSIKKIVLERNEKFYGQKPYLEKLSFYFYENTEDLKRAASVGEIDGFPLSDPLQFKFFEKEGFKIYHISLPRYFALFFNLRNAKISNKKIRTALSFAVDKEEILNKVFLGNGEKVSSPIINDYYGFNPPQVIFPFNPEKAKEILEKEGFKENTTTGIREKKASPLITSFFKNHLEQGDQGEEVRQLQKCLAQDKEIYPEGEINGYFGTKTKEAVSRFQQKYFYEILKPAGLSKPNGKVGTMTIKKLNELCPPTPPENIVLKFTLTTSDKSPLTEMAEIIKKQFKNIGVEIEIKRVSLAELQTDILAKRNFEMLLFGEALGQIPDPFSFWHSSQKEYPGLNIASYNSKTADKLLEQARETSDPKERKEKLEKFQDILLEDAPAIFLVGSNYSYALHPNIKGFKVEKISESSKRFSAIENLYLKTKRIWLSN